MDQSHYAFERGIDTVSQQAVRLPAAYFHQRPGPRGRVANLLHQSLTVFRLAIFVEVFHDRNRLASPQ
jgi:hypothetical protein